MLFRVIKSDISKGEGTLIAVPMSIALASSLWLQRAHHLMVMTLMCVLWEGRRERDDVACVDMCI
jgi:hypothetical protein